MKIRVLLVDDEQEFVEVLAERLEVRDIVVTKAFSGDEALAGIKEKAVDVVILDVSMPGKDGVATLKEIKQFNPIIEVIMLTGMTGPGAVVTPSLHFPQANLSQWSSCSMKCPGTYSSLRVTSSI